MQQGYSSSCRLQTIVVPFCPAALGVAVPSRRCTAFREELRDMHSQSVSDQVRGSAEVLLGLMFAVKLQQQPVSGIFVLHVRAASSVPV